MTRSFQALVRGGWRVPGDRLAVVTNTKAGERIIDVLQIRTMEMTVSSGRAGRPGL